MAFKKIRRFVGSRLSPETKLSLIHSYQRLSLRRLQRRRKAAVFLISFPKCGRTWLRLMIGKAFQLHFQLETHDILALYDMADLAPEIPRILVTHDDNPQWKKRGTLETSKIRYKNKKVILLVRDPRDTIISLYFQKVKRKKVYSGSLHDYLYEPDNDFDRLLAFYDIWYQNRHIPQDLLLVRYENLKQNTEAELSRVIQFLGLSEISKPEIEGAVDFASFDNMRQLERSGSFSSGGQLKPKNPADESSYKTRKGKVGGFMDYLDDQEIADLNGKMMRKLPAYFGYTPNAG